MYGNSPSSVFTRTRVSPELAAGAASRTPRASPSTRIAEGCTDLDFSFRNLVSPFDVNHMQEFVSNPYLVHTFSASEFEVHEP